MASYIFEDWKKLLDNFQQCVEKDLEEIHQQKAEVQQIKTDVFNRLSSGLYYRDSKRIVISAPEVIIGNVDKGGMMSHCQPSSKHPAGCRQSRIRRYGECRLRTFADYFSGCRHRVAQQ